MPDSKKDPFSKMMGPDNRDRSRRRRRSGNMGGGPSGPAMRGGPSGPAMRGGPSGPAMRGGPSGPAMRGGPSGPAMRGAGGSRKRKKNSPENSDETFRRLFG